MSDLSSRTMSTPSFPIARHFPQYFALHSGSCFNSLYFLLPANHSSGLPSTRLLAKLILLLAKILYFHCVPALAFYALATFPLGSPKRKLCPREIESLLALCTHLTYKQLARRLGALLLHPKSVQLYLYVSSCTSFNLRFHMLLSFIFLCRLVSVSKN